MKFCALHTMVAAALPAPSNTCNSTFALVKPEVPVSVTVKASAVEDPAAKIEELAARYDDARQGRLDGISIDYEDWHFNVRPSNTEPLLRLCLESLVSPADMERRRDEVLALIRAPMPPGV